MPGPEIRLMQGQRLTTVFENALPQASSIHWHGIRIDNGMDGVAGLTQEAVPPGEHFLYDFTVPDAGTYWYHSHNRTYEQLARGLGGPLIIEERTPPEVDEEIVLALDDWRLTEQATLHDSFDSLHDRAHAGRIGNWITVNGQGSWTRVVQRNARLRLRLINMANARVFELSAKSLSGWIVALDGMPLDQPEPLSSLTLAPAQRADLLVDVDGSPGAEVFLLSQERQGSFALATFVVSDDKRAHPLEAPAPLPANPATPLVGLEDARRVDLRMEGGARGRMASAQYKGETLDTRALAERGMAWALNGMAGMPDSPLAELQTGEPVRIILVNDTAWPHAMHVHGHHFQEILPDGGLGPLRDTILVHRTERREIAFMADNPGKWMMHCHMLGHAYSGMMTWFTVG